jgi:hypothetical protein
MTDQTNIKYQNYDLLVKESLTIFKNKTLEFLGLSLPKIVDVIKTDLYKIETKNKLIDMNFLLEDNSILHLEEEIHISENDLIRFAETDLLLYDSRKTKIHTVVLVLGENKNNKSKIEAGSLNYTVEIVNLTGQDGVEKYKELKRKIENKEEINELELIFLPLMKNVKEKIEVLDDAINLTRQIETNDDEKGKIISMLLVLMDKFIDENKILSVWEDLKMLNIIKIAEKKGRLEGILEGEVKGEVKGEIKGEVKGKILGKGELLEKLLIKKFPGDYNYYEKKIKSLQPEVIDFLATDLLTMTNANEMDKYFQSTVNCS